MILGQNATRQHVSSFDLDLLDMGGLDDAKKQTIDEHLRTCADCRAEHETLRRLRADFTDNVLPRTVNRVRERAGNAARPWFQRPEVFAPVLASAAAFALWAASSSLGSRSSTIEATEEGVLAKGKAGLEVVARHAGHVAPVDTAHPTLSAGDEVRFVVTVAEPAFTHLLIASIDGRGRASVYFPFGGTESARVEHAGRWEVPGSIVLDDAPGPERVFAVFSKEPLAASAVTGQLEAVGRKGAGAIRTTAHLDLGSVDQSSFVIEKTSPGAP